MAKKSICWRDPQGRSYFPKNANDTKHAPLALIKTYIEYLDFDNGKVVINNPFEIKKFETALQASFALNESGASIDYIDAWSFLNKAICNKIQSSGQKDKIKLEEIIFDADKLAKSYLRKKTKNYSLVTSLSIDKFPSNSISILGCSITALKSRYDYYSLPKSNTVSIPNNLINHIEATKYTPIRIKTSGRSVSEAAQKAFGALDLLRGIWNFLITFRNWSVNYGVAVPKPLGAIACSPIHTLHYPSGKMVNDSYWYAPSYMDDITLYKPKSGWKRIERDRHYIAGKITYSPYKSDLVYVFRRYCDALDATNTNVAFLHLWGVLEKITDTVGAHYDTTIKRASWIFSKKDQPLTREILQALRIKRNQVVHAGHDTHDQILYLIKYFIDPHLRLLINNIFEVRSLSEYGKFLESSTSYGVLKSQRKQVELAMKIRRSWDR
ncbi:hypothetical protein JD969_19785 [Planctomycetota bacterium]|nr:hypothetical protein JD969_19785 [Planctomycetota bacterium]